MTGSRRLAFALAVLATLAAPCAGKEWRTFVPLQTTRADVIGILGAPTPGDSPGAEQFNLSTETVVIRWIRPGCKTPFDGVNRASLGLGDVVYQVSVTPKTPFPTTQLGLTGPKSMADWLCCDVNCTGTTECGYACTEMNSISGFGYSTSTEGLVTATYYFPTKDQVATWDAACDAPATR